MVQILLELKILSWLLEFPEIVPCKIQRNSLKINKDSYIKFFVVTKNEDGPILFFKSFFLQATLIPEKLSSSDM